MEYETKRDPKTGRIKPEERLTPARRYSYLVGADEECHTAQSRFLALLQDTGEPPTLAQIEEAFSVEAVTKEFFREYVRLFDDTEAALAAVVKRDKAVRDDFIAILGTFPLVPAPVKVVALGEFCVAGTGH